MAPTTRNTPSKAVPERAEETEAPSIPGQWLASNPSKRWAELFFLAYSPFWILWALCILVPFQLFEVER